MSKAFLLGLLLLFSGLVFWIESESRQQPLGPEKAKAYLSFISWMQKHGKEYRETEEKLYRFQQYQLNYQQIEEHNRRYEEGLETYTLEVNGFADLHNAEFVALYTGLKKGVTKQCTGTVDTSGDLPEQVDWAAKGAVSSVKNQGQCGSCWAFSACGAMEGLDALQRNSTARSFSPQQLVDCAGGPYENEGCNGGDMPNAMWYVTDHGITTEEKYPYKGKDQKKCEYQEKMKAFQMPKCARVTPSITSELQHAVKNQPVAISVDAAGIGFQFYKSGVFSGKCGIDLDHGILLTGYGTEGGKDYWKAKNSWGSSWGNNGYMLLARGKEPNGQCGILMDNSVPLL